MRDAIPRAVQSLLDQFSGRIQEAILESISDITTVAEVGRLVSAVESGSADAVLRLLHLDEEFFEPVDRALRSVYLDGGTFAASQATAGAPRGSRLVVRFSGRSQAAEDWMRERSSSLISEITSSAREAVRSVLMSGLVEGRNPRDVVTDLIGRRVQTGGGRVGGVIGLNSRLVEYLSAARAELASGDPEQLSRFLGRALRDKRYDTVVRTAIETGRSVSSEAQKSMTAHYSDNLLKFRARAIARTEATAALNASRHEVVAQAVASGRVSDKDVTRRWRAAGADGRTRDTHQSMDNQVVVGLREPFVSPSGARMMHPGDTSLGAPGEETINCRCYEEIKIDFIAVQARAERGVS